MSTVPAQTSSPPATDLQQGPLRAESLADSTDPAALLDFAWAMEPPLRLSDRRAALDRLEALLEDDAAPAAPAGRDWQLELWAEQAIDAAAADRLEEGCELADRVLAAADEDLEIAIARATLARGRVLAWRGTDECTRAADGVLVEAAERFATLGRVGWQAFTTFWRGHAVYYENGWLLDAERLMRAALELLAYSSPRRGTILEFYADVLADLGEWDRAEAVLDEAYRLAKTIDNAKGRAYVSWTRAHVAAGRGDAVRAERLFREVERDATDWWERYGANFLCDAARTLDMLGLTPQAEEYLERAVRQLKSTPAGSGHAPEEFEPLAAARALLLARSGDPAAALESLQALARRRWLEKRLLWRFTLLGAWASLRAGNRDEAARDAARALDQAIDSAGISVALAGEPELTQLLAPLAQEAGSVPACELLSTDRQLTVRLFGAPQVTDRTGRVLDLPAGRPSELVRMLAAHDHGLPVEAVLETFFPEVAPAVSRHRLRQVLTRLRTAAGDVVVRDGEILRLAPAWVDLREFRSLARRTRAARGTRAVQLLHGALALADRGPLLVSDRYADWAGEVRDEVDQVLERLRDARP